MIEDLEKRLQANNEKVDPLRRGIDHGLWAIGGGILVLFSESALLGPNLLIPPITPERILVSATLAFAAGAGIFTSWRMLQVIGLMRERVPLLNQRTELLMEASLEEMNQKRTLESN